MCKPISLLLLFLFAFLPFTGHTQSQSTPPGKLTLGVEQDVLPYVTGGYFAGLWAGKKHVRVRTLIAQVHKPDWLVKEGFTNNRVTAYALLGDYFLKENWRGWWAATGLVYWKSKIQSSEQRGTASYQNVLLNGSLGYHFTLYKNFYAGPWAGMHLRIGGDKQVSVDGRNFRPALLNPEASVKLGWFLR